MKKIQYTFVLMATTILFACNSNTETADANDEHATAVEEKACTYTISDAKVAWTAYKTSEKIGVGGAFDEVEVKGGTANSSLKAVLESISFKINTGSTNTNNEARDTKIVNSFFGAMTNTEFITGEVLEVNGDDNAGKCTFSLKLNDMDKELVLDYTIAENVIKMTGTMDVTTWNGTDALASLNTVCSEKHKGNGDKSISWPDVDLSLEATLTKNCK